MRSDDFREELLSAKKAHQLALRENSHFRTRLRIAESECRRREAEIERLLKAQSDKSAEGNRAKARLEMASLRRKVLLYERMLHEKSAENEKLMSDKGVAQAADTRKMVDKLETECQRLRAHLAQSVPESEFLREKEQYTAIINKLVEENMHLRNVIGEFETRRMESERLIAELGGNDALVRQFRQSAITSKKALGNLIKTKGYGSGESVSIGREKESERERADGTEKEQWKRMDETRERRKSESDRSCSKHPREEKTKQNSANNSESRKEGKTEEKKLETETDRKEMIIHSREERDEERGERKNGDKIACVEADRSSSAGALPSSSSCCSTRAASSPRGAVLPSSAAYSTASDDEEEEEADIEESQLNALFRVLHSHILRQQMLKVRRESGAPNFV